MEETLLYLDILRGGGFAPEPRDSPFELSPSERQRLRRTAATVARETLVATYDALARGRRQELAAEVLAWAEVAWRRLRRTPAAGRRALVEAQEELRSWGLCVLVCEASVAAAAHKATAARELAELALFIADRIPGSDIWRARVQGYAWAFVGNARRVGNDLDGAERAFTTARSLWEAGAAADPGVLDASRLPDLEASLRRDRRQWARALVLLERALDASPSAERSGRIQLNKASVHIQQGVYADALAQLESAAPLIADQREARLLWVYHFNFGVCLCRLTRYAEAVREVAAARELAVALRNDLDLARVLWLEGQVLAGLGRREEAIAALRQVREDFARRGLPADGALATLELAVLLLEEGRTGEVRELALEMLPIFDSLGFEEEALAALRLFWEAAEQGTATAELGRRLLAFLERARYDPDLRFSESPVG